MQINETVADIIGIARPGDVIVLRARQPGMTTLLAEIEQLRTYAPGVAIMVVDGQAVDADLRSGVLLRQDGAQAHDGREP